MDKFLKDNEVNVDPASRYAQIRKLILKFADKDKGVNLHMLNVAMLDMTQLKALINTHSGIENRAHELKKAFIKDNFVPDNNNSKGRDALFEYYAASRMLAIGCKITRDEPDLICNYKGTQFGIACKRSTLSTLEFNIKKAKKQILATGLPGIIMVDVSHNDPYNNEKFFLGHFNEKRLYVHKWMEKNFNGVIKENASKWGILPDEIPYIIGVHIGACYMESNQSCVTMSHTWFWRISVKGTRSLERRHFDDTFEVIIDNFGPTLPEGEIFI